MKIIRETTEDDAIAVFLGGELTSKRFGDLVRGALEKYDAEDSVITNPDLTNSKENKLRRKLLRKARGYGTGKSWFGGWPKSISWHRVTLSRAELPNIRFIVYSYWIELTKGSLRSGDAVKTITDGEERFGVSNQPFIDLSHAIANGHALPPMILVGTSEKDLVVLEGHARLTAYLLAGEKAPNTVEAIVGFSPDFVDWGMHSFDAYNRRLK